MSFQHREYQLNAVQSFITDIETFRSVGIILPTGSGKTEIFVEICKRYTEANPTKAVLILSHLSLLTEQTYERFKIRAPSVNVAIMQGQTKARWNSSVIISTMQTSRSADHIAHLKENTVRNVGLIIVDEAHYIPNTSYQQILNYFPDAKIGGFTATPFRDKKIMTSYFDKISYSMSLQELIDNGYLVPPVLHQIEERGSSIEDIMATVLNLYKQHQMGKQAIVYMQSIDHARLLKSAFDDIGISAHAITSELVGEYRSQILSSYNSGTIKVLTTVNVLTAGFDSPNVESIFMPYATQSPTTYVQRIGRGLRLNPAIGKDHCDVYVFGDAPSISKRIYEKMNNLVLFAGGKPKSYDTHKDDLFFSPHETTSDIYVWNKSVVDTIDKMEKLGMNEFARLLDQKQFPKRFMDNINKLIATLPNKKKNTSGDVLATAAQKSVLIRSGFTSDQMASVTKHEASMMIGSIFNQENRVKKQTPYTVTEGMHAGKEVYECPHAYRSYMKKHYPDNPVTKTIIQWEERKKA